jgi:hypothetical protein
MMGSLIFQGFKYLGFPIYAVLAIFQGFKYLGFPIYAVLAIFQASYS